MGGVRSGLWQNTREDSRCHIPHMLSHKPWRGHLELRIVLLRMFCGNMSLVAFSRSAYPDTKNRCDMYTYTCLQCYLMYSLTWKRLSCLFFLTLNNRKSFRKILLAEYFITVLGRRNKALKRLLCYKLV